MHTLRGRDSARSYVTCSRIICSGPVHIRFSFTIHIHICPPFPFPRTAYEDIESLLIVGSCINLTLPLSDVNCWKISRLGFSNGGIVPQTDKRKRDNLQLYCSGLRLDAHYVHIARRPDPKISNYVRRNSAVPKTSKLPPQECSGNRKLRDPDPAEGGGC